MRYIRFVTVSFEQVCLNNSTNDSTIDNTSNCTNGSTGANAIVNTIESTSNTIKETINDTTNASTNVSTNHTTNDNTNKSTNDTTTDSTNDNNETLRLEDDRIKMAAAESREILDKIYFFHQQSEWAMKVSKPAYTGIYKNKGVKFEEYMTMCQFYFAEFREHYFRRVPLKLAIDECFTKAKKTWIADGAEPLHLRRSITKIGTNIYEKIRKNPKLYFPIKRVMTRSHYVRSNNTGTSQ
jgi:hypothetical protein